LGPFGSGLPDLIPKSFDPIFIKVIKAAKKPRTTKRYMGENNISVENKKNFWKSQEKLLHY